MTFVKYKNSNNASSKLITDISASATTLLITDGDQDLFPAQFPYLLTLEHSDSEGNVIVREIVKVIASAQNSLTVERGAGECVQDDTATNRVQGNSAHVFNVGDSVSLYWTSEQVKDIQDAVSELEINSAKAESIADEYDNTQTYSIGDTVMYQGERYVCNTDILTAEDFDPIKWTKTSVQSDFQNVQNVVNQVAPFVSSLKDLKVMDVIVVGGGGGGGGAALISTNCGTFAGSGGGGGQVIAGQYLGVGNCYDVIIGCRGERGAASSGLICGKYAYQTAGDGGDTHFGQLVAFGGKGGAIGSSNCCSKGGNSGVGFLGAGAPSSYSAGGGGGGASGNGCCCTNCNSMGGDGGPGLCGYGGGGGGGGVNSSRGGYGCDGGGNGGKFGGTDCHPGGYDATNYGGGGGGGSECSTSCYARGGYGYQGIVVVKYPADGSGGICCATGGTITTEMIGDIEYCVHTFTSNGVFCIVC